MSSVFAEAPSNIALIKYMGKEDSSVNTPTNTSLSFSLNHLRTRVELTAATKDCWAPLESSEWSEISLSARGQMRFLNFFALLKKEFGVEGEFKISSANNFPSDCGLASSASSFAALTKATYKLALLQNPSLDLTMSDLSYWSRKGSGSSCRSLFNAFAEWTGERAEGVDLGYENLGHQVFIVDGSKKEVSSSEAHLRVLSSLNFQGRVDRAQKRVSELKSSLLAKDWKKSFEICWSEFWDMHSLFETSDPSFGYMTPGSLDVLNKIRNIWNERGDGPIVTMDAGANVHALYRMDQRELARELKSRLSEYACISNYGDL